MSLSSPWPQNVTYLPENSETFINCTYERGGRCCAMNWLILLSGSESYVSFGSSDMLLNGRGFYDTTEYLSPPLQLYINRTEGNNGTVIQCIDSYLSRIISETTLIVIGTYTISATCTIYTP